jgi:hypothetical protein
MQLNGLRRAQQQQRQTHALCAHNVPHTMSSCGNGSFIHAHRMVRGHVFNHGSWKAVARRVARRGVGGENRKPENSPRRKKQPSPPDVRASPLVRGSTTHTGVDARLSTRTRGDGEGQDITYFGRTAVVVRFLRKAANVAFEESRTCRAHREYSRGWVGEGKRRQNKILIQRERRPM